MCRLDRFEKEEIRDLLRQYSVQYVARLIGYKGRKAVYARNAFAYALRKRGWWDEFKQEGII